jgi:hypothetical protein
METQPAILLEYNGASRVVPQRLVNEILAAIDQREGGKPKAVHSSIQATLQAAGWRRDALVAPGLNHRFDALKDGIAVEIEFWSQENAFKEWAKFQKAFVRGSLAAGVHIMRRHRDDPADCSADWALRTLDAFSDVFAVPVLVLGVDI